MLEEAPWWNNFYLEADDEDIRLAVRERSDGVKVGGATGVPDYEVEQSSRDLPGHQELVEAGRFV